ncbi:MAG: hypothetical protein ABJA67_09315 [Chthonomonadales bacterium]
MTWDHHDILCEFIAADVEYMVVGAVAMAGYGYPRATGDLGLWVRANSENAVRIVKALRSFCAPAALFDESIYAVPRQTAQVGVQPNRVDITTIIDGITF